MRKIINFRNNPPSFISYAAVGGYEERRGPLGEKFDLCDPTDRFGMDTWELAEGEMGRISLNVAMNKAHLSPDALDVLLAGDLENQCVASSGGLYSFGIPYIGLYSACSTCTEALLLLSTLISHTEIELGGTVTTSHNSAAERQFRTPIEYGGQRTPTAQWTATASGAFVLGHGGRVKILDGMVGKIVDGLTADASNMGAAMARAAFDSIYNYFTLSEVPVRDFDYIITGDLGKVGSKILEEMIERDMPDARGRHIDCGNLLYSSENADIHAGASGCGCSASVLAAHFLPELEAGRMKNILFLSTGALMSPTSVMQGENILGIAPVIHISTEDVC
ncbi:MAG: stage V sporulation protein AD [Clostridia bacterium]|nr:stage V sporulation protein AD [Clostridia bacterium]